MRVIFDTNVLIDGSADDHSSSAKLLSAAARGQLEMLVTLAISREYTKLLWRRISDPTYLTYVEELIHNATVCLPEPADSELIIDDPDDLKFIEAGLGGQAQLLITRDRHLLDIGEVAQLCIVTPDEGWQRLQETDASKNEWDYWKKGLGI